MKIGFAGMSHLGVVTSTATAAKGFDVVAYGEPATISEPGLPELLAKHPIRHVADAAARARTPKASA